MCYWFDILFNLPGYTWFAITLTSESFARSIKASNCVAITIFTAIARDNVEITILALVTITANHIWLTTTVSYMNTIELISCIKLKF